MTFPRIKLHHGRATREARSASAVAPQRTRRICIKTDPKSERARRGGKRAAPGRGAEFEKLRKVNKKLTNINKS